MSEPLTKKELVEKMARRIYKRYYTDTNFSWERLGEESQGEILNEANHILALTEDYYKEKYKSYVQLADAQILPDESISSLTGDKPLEMTMNSFAKRIQHNMVEANWRKVKL